MRVLASYPIISLPESGLLQAGEPRGECTVATDTVNRRSKVFGIKVNFDSMDQDVLRKMLGTFSECTSLVLIGSTVNTNLRKTGFTYRPWVLWMISAWFIAPSSQVLNVNTGIGILQIPMPLRAQTWTGNNFPCQGFGRLEEPPILFSFLLWENFGKTCLFFLCSNKQSIYLVFHSFRKRKEPVWPFLVGRFSSRNCNHCLDSS